MATALALDFDLAGTPEFPSTLGPYDLLEYIAGGGMASIFRGRDPETGEIVALKTVRTALPYEVVGLDREIATLRSLRHPGVVRFVTEGTWNDTPWMAMELLQGRTLVHEVVSMWSGRLASRPHAADCEPVGDCSWIESLCSDRALASPARRPAAGRLRDALTLVGRLVPALEYIHRRGIVHCDLKPENVFLGDDGRMTLLDFGLARRIDAHRTVDADACCVGTMEYVAPEQVCGDPRDARTDLYSLGCILYELVTGRRPFESQSPDEVARMHVDSEPVCPSDLVSGLSWQVEDLMLALLAKDPTLRPRDAGEVRSRLGRLIDRCP